MQIVHTIVHTLEIDHNPLSLMLTSPLIYAACNLPVHCMNKAEIVMDF